ncbi:group II intron reverse transcriptase/maturase [Virgibacillus sp. 179-BFC.A HS]|uniref:Group II intron reverse transcriptase/maturase n=1 Tax=Tigheibacillus jepli TaxID=3035914 RepID=A0ABU5CDH1_9BACI|nr:group II intron reverse transcriptase/maturase [Virgibacillus sp. 179-BFC.A HS]MDY0404389.1 group II intron reverse transcriptase/maturase [Virgibacillus sp. 179-BFC.A HS]
MKKRVWYSLYDKVCRKSNLLDAFYQVRANKGAPGVDNVTIEDYEWMLEDNLEVLQQKLKEKTYRPKPVRRKMIEKGNGKMRPLGIPTVEDRVVQAAIRNILEPIFEGDFLPCSYGFRPGIGAHMAINKVTEHLRNGYEYVIDADLQSYFDTIPHDKLEEQIRQRVVDGSVIRLINQFLKAGVMEGELYEDTPQGAPQGGVLSPLLSNIYLHQLDQLMTKRGHRIVRFADDFIILCKSQKGATRVMKSVTKYLESGLGLTVHPTKTKVVHARYEPFTFLGYEFIGNIRRIDPKKEAKFKKRIKEITKRNQTVDIQILIETKLNPYIRGWANYFRHGNVKTKFKSWDAWIRRRLRMVQLRSWRYVKNLHRELRKKGWREENLRGIRMFAWRSSKSPMVHAAMDNQFFLEANLVSLTSVYDELYL